jgi:hypothetical protein
MVDARNPIATSIGPIVSEAGPPSPAIGSNDEPIVDGAMVRDLDAHGRLAVRMEWDVKLIRRARESDQGAVDPYTVDR